MDDFLFSETSQMSDEEDVRNIFDNRREKKRRELNIVQKRAAKNLRDINCQYDPCVWQLYIRSVILSSMGR